MRADLTPPSRRVRGAATLAIVSLLLLVMAVIAAALQRGMVFEQKAAAHQYRATQAQEAAEAGVEWALARLNAGRLDDQCEPAASGRSLRERALKPEPSMPGQFDPGFDASLVAAPACSQADGGWQCHCPAVGRATPPLHPDDRLHPAFRVELSGGASAIGLQGVVHITSFGCAHAAIPFCAEQPGGEPGRAVSTVQAALLPALTRLPAAPVVAAGNIDLGGALVRNTDAQAGLLAQAGGAVRADGATLVPPAGTPPALALAQHDAALAARTSDQLLLQYAGLSRPAFEQLPGLASLRCGDACAAPLQAAVASGRRRVRIAGDLVLRDTTLGTALAPVLLVVDGDIRLGPGVRIAGVLLGRSLRWQAASNADGLDGAAILAGEVQLQGSPSLVRDAQVLQRLRTDTGTFVRIPGSWRDAT